MIKKLVDRRTEVASPNYRTKRWDVLRWFLIPDGREPDVVYLKRLRLIQTPWFGWYIHWIYLPDRDRDPHDHPWNFWSLILRGGYTEQVWQKWGAQRIRVDGHGAFLGEFVWKAFSWHKMSIERAHMIHRLQPGTVSMIFTGPRHRTWGFWTREEFVPYTKYDKGAGPDPFMS